MTVGGRRGWGFLRASRKVRARGLALAQAWSPRSDRRDPARNPPRPFSPDADASARGMRGAGCGVWGAAGWPGPRGDARPRRGKGTQAGRGAQVPWAGTASPHLPVAPPARPRPRAPGTTYPVMGTAATAASATAGLSLRANGRRPAGHDPLQGQKGPAQGGLFGGTRRDPRR